MPEFIGDLYRIPSAHIRQECVSAFNLFGLNDHADTLIKDLFHGYRQRTIDAATFLRSPKVLFVDEPFVGLDPLSIRLIRDLLKTT